MTKQVVDITANWQAAEGWSDRILVREPAVREGERRSFRQSLILPAGSYELELVYDAADDHFQPPVLVDSEAFFHGLRVDGRPCAIELAPRDAAGPVALGSNPGGRGRAGDYT